MFVHTLGNRKILSWRRLKRFLLDSYGTAIVCHNKTLGDIQQQPTSALVLTYPTRSATSRSRVGLLTWKDQRTNESSFLRDTNDERLRKRSSTLTRLLFTSSDTYFPHSKTPQEDNTQRTGVNSAAFYFVELVLGVLVWTALFVLRNSSAMPRTQPTASIGNDTCRTATIKCQRPARLADEPTDQVKVQSCQHDPHVSPLFL